MYLLRKIKPEKRDENQREDVMETCSSYAKELLNDNDDVCERTSALAVSCSIGDIADDWITEEDKNLLRYYYYILHEVDDARVGTLDSDTLKKIMSMVSAEWQKRYTECLERSIHEIKYDYITNMKKSIVDFVLQEPFGVMYESPAPVSII